MPNKLDRWMAIANQQEQTTLAESAKTTKGYLIQLRHGNRTASAEMAKRLEVAAEKLRTKNPTLPTLLRTDLCPTCRACEYAKACGAGK